MHCPELQNREFHELAIGIGWEWFFTNHPELWNSVDGIGLFSIFTNLRNFRIGNQKLGIGINKNRNFFRIM